MNDSMISDSIWKMSDYLSRYYGKKAIIMEFKVISTKKEKSLEETVQTALTQIKEKCYDAELYDRGLKKEEIHHYGFAFEGKNVLILD